MVSSRYKSGPGSPVARALGSGWVLELLSRLTHTPITPTSGPVSPHQLFSANTTLTSNPTTFPLNNTIYSDATHEGTMLYIYTALNLTVLAEDGTPNLTKMKRASKRRWVTSRFAPFGSNMQVQGEYYSVDSDRDLDTL
jgi:Histidine phosphatase superfamily (branch 2)